MNRIYKIILLTLLMIPNVVYSEQKIVIDKDVIKGNIELPKVMYIIPWRKTIVLKAAPELRLRNYYDELLKPVHLYEVGINNAVK